MDHIISIVDYFIANIGIFEGGFIIGLSDWIIGQDWLANQCYHIA